MATKIDSTSWTGVPRPEPPEPLDPKDLRPVSKYHRSTAGRAGLAAFVLFGAFICVSAIALVATLLQVLGGDATAADWIRGPEWNRWLVLVMSPVLVVLGPALIWWSLRQISEGAAGRPVLLLDDQGLEDRRYGLGPIPWHCVTRVLKLGESSVRLEFGGDPLPDRRGRVGFMQFDVESRSLAVSHERLQREIVTRWLLARGELSSRR